MLHTLHRDPHQYGVERARWTLATLLESCDWLGLATPSSVHRLLDRLDIRLKRARDYVHSPDPDYLPKLAYHDQIRERVLAAEGREVLLYQDEMTFYRQPTLASTWEAQGRAQPLARRSYGSNTATRITATLDARDGRVVYWQGSVCGIDAMVRFYRQLRQAYPAAERLWVVQDNWPIHFHPDVLVALEPQEHPWPTPLPPSWSTEPHAAAKRRWGDWQLPIQLVPLPTYASWCNPIEKLWRQLRQERLHLHRLADRLDELRQETREFLDALAQGSAALLRYVGLPVSGGKALRPAGAW